MSSPLMSHKKVIEFIRDFVFCILDLAKGFGGAALVWVVNTGGLSVGCVYKVEVEGWVEVEGLEILLQVAH